MRGGIARCAEECRPGEDDVLAGHRVHDYLLMEVEFLPAESGFRRRLEAWADEIAAWVTEDLGGQADRRRSVGD